MREVKNRRKRRRHRRRKQRQKHWLSNTILIIAFLIFFVAAFQLFRIGKGYLDGRNEYEKIRNIATTTNDRDKKDDGNEFKVDFDKLLEINPDTIGWIRCYLFKCG